MNNQINNKDVEYIIRDNHINNSIFNNGNVIRFESLYYMMIFMISIFPIYYLQQVMLYNESLLSQIICSIMIFIFFIVDIFIFFKHTKPRINFAEKNLKSLNLEKDKLKEKYLQ